MFSFAAGRQRCVEIGKGGSTHWTAASVSQGCWEAVLFCAAVAVQDCILTSKQSLFRG
jgi:hypothetical protein